MGLVYVKSTLSVTNDGGVIYRLNSGEAWDSEDPIVKARPHLFSDIPPGVRTHRGWVPPEAVIETATAKPGERRKTK